MEADLKILEESLERFITQSEHLRVENHQLRQALAQAQSDGRQLKENVLLASSRLQSIMQKLPQDMIEEVPLAIPEETL